MEIIFWNTNNKVFMKREDEVKIRLVKEFRCNEDARQFVEDMQEMIERRANNE